MSSVERAASNGRLTITTGDSEFGGPTRTRTWDQWIHNPRPHLSVLGNPNVSSRCGLSHRPEGRGTLSPVIKDT